MDDAIDYPDTEMTVANAPWNQLEYLGPWRNYPGPYEEQEEFKFVDASVVLRVEYVIYQVHIGMFISLSPVWKAILEIPSSTTNDADPEGSKGNPIFLEGITVDEMDDFLVYIYRQLWTDRRYASMQAVERSHVNLLKLASLWQIETARKYAITHLEESAGLHFRPP
ncbi:hypothetical protein C8F01DRAFT_1264555 [Mycena amicta]|nr:hypothetical protein C8F01DRAFT_1264555 [Mycena amicta]